MIVKPFRRKVPWFGRRFSDSKESVNTNQIGRTGLLTTIHVATGSKDLIEEDNPEMMSTGRTIGQVQ